MKAGLIAAYDILELTASGSDSFSLSDTGNGVVLSATMLGRQTYNQIQPYTVQKFWGIERSGTVAATTGTNTGQVLVGIFPDGMGGYVNSYTTSIAVGSSWNATIDVNDFRLYIKNGWYYFTWSSIVLKINGATKATIAGGTWPSVTPAGARLAPTGCPLLGLPATASCTISESASLIYPSGPLAGSTTPYSQIYQGSASISGGYRFQEVGSGVWSSPSCHLLELIGGNTGCPCDPNGLPAISGGTTSTLSASSSFYQERSCTDLGTFPIVTGGIVPGTQELYLTKAWQQNSSSWVMGLPSLTRSIKRFAKDYAALWYRGGLPKTTQYYHDICTSFLSGQPVVTGDVEVTSNPHPTETTFLARVGDSASIIEDPFNWGILSPYNQGAVKIYSQTLSIVVLTPAIGGTPINYAATYPQQACVGDQGSAFPSVVEDIHANPQLTPGLYNQDPLTGWSDTNSRYVDYWAAPQWNYAYWFPPDIASGALQGYEWPVDNARANPSKYWIPGRMQWQWNPGLSPIDATKKRNDLISAPLFQGGLQAFTASYWGNNNNLFQWVGVCRFKADQQTIPSSYTMLQAQTAPWSFTNATSSFGVSSITLTPTGSPSTVTASLALGSFGNAPYQVFAFIKSVLAAWSGLGISGCTVSLVGADATSVNLGTVSGSTYPFPSGVSDVKYAGSWGQNFGAGFLSTDTGTDATGSGISSTEMASNQNSFEYQLLFGWTAAKLVFTFAISDASKTITLNYPVFNLNTTPTLVQETAFASISVFPQGGAFRYGMWDWWNYTTPGYQDPPTVYSFGTPSSSLDWLATKRVTFLQESSTTGLDAEWATLYDSVEASARSDIANGTNSFVILANSKLTGVMVCGFEEIPPLAIFPVKARDINMATTGGYACESWSHAKGPRDIVSAQVPAVLFDSSGTQRSTLQAGSPAGWVFHRFDSAVTNTEDTGWSIRSGGNIYAHVSPWHGYSAVLAPLVTGAQPYLHQSEWGSLHLATITPAGDIRYRWSADTGPHWVNDTNITLGTTFAGGWARPRMTTDHRTFIELRAYHTNQGGGDPLSTGTYRMWSYDLGKTWGPISGGILAPETD